MITAAKPLGRKAYGSIGHLPNSRLGKGDHSVPEGCATICTVKARDKHDRIILQEKLDGCLAWRTPVLTDRGVIGIGVIVNQRLPVKVLSYNVSLGVAEYKPIMHYHAHKRVLPWVRVTVQTQARGTPTKAIICTTNHRFYSKGDWVEANSLHPGDLVAHVADKISSEAEQVILGGLLGDSSISRPQCYNRPTLTFGHSISQSGYFEFKLRLLRSLMHEIKGARGGFPGSRANRRALSHFTPSVSRLIQEFCVRKEKKCVTRQWVDYLSPLGLAIWYMDDGSCRFTTEQRPRAHLAVNGYSWEEAERLSKMLSGRFRVANAVFDYKGPTIVMTADGTERFFDLIYPYVPQCMKYKLPEKYGTRLCVLGGDCEFHSYQGVIESRVLSVEHENVNVWSVPGMQYDITVAGNHNYFASGVLVHNSCVAVALLDGKIIPLGRVGWPAETSPYEQHQIFAQWVRFNEDRFRSVLHEGERLVGEWLAQAHGTIYDFSKHDRDPFGAFDIMVADERVPYDEFRSRVAPVFNVPNLLHDGGPITTDDAMALCRAKHWPCDQVEGVVYRVHRKGKVDFLAKYVTPSKVDGKYLPEVSGQPAVWNWRPNW